MLGTSNFEQWKDGVNIVSKLGFEIPKYEPENLANMVPNASPEGINLLRQLLQFSPAKRIKISEILKHPFFGGTVGSRLARTISLTTGIKSKNLLCSFHLLKYNWKINNYNKKRFLNSWCI